MQRDIAVGPVADPGTQVGPLVDVAAAGRVDELIEDALARDARRLCGGSREQGLVPPTRLADATAEMRIMRREAFGPVVAVAPFDTLDEVVAEANAIGGANHTGIFTGNLDTAFRLADEVDAGGVIINGSTHGASIRCHKAASASPASAGRAFGRWSRNTPNRRCSRCGDKAANDGE